MEIERKFLVDISRIPADFKQYPHHVIEQAYILTEPVLRIRKKDDTYILTYKGAGFMQREEAEFPLTAEAYRKLLAKTEGNIITKTRYKIPEHDNLLIELDIFSGMYEGLYLAEVEFPDAETANSYNPPEWFGTEVTYNGSFHNSALSMLSKTQAAELINNLQ